MSVGDFMSCFISIHAPRGGSDVRPSWRSTDLSVYFNPRSPWGERPPLPPSIAPMPVISIHAPRGGSDLFGRRATGRTMVFQSTLPVGGATFLVFSPSWYWYISIHAPRGGSDECFDSEAQYVAYFNPRSPWGERPETYDKPPTLSDISIHAPRGGSDVSIGIRHPVFPDFNPRSPWGERPAEFLCHQRSA